ncbi:uncharacterized protein FA14DRAFT_154614 [Meira miltonrushii]|uniref:Zn(2)-C6 fungal-type domain-containing protein n=1 Tax=Meira miltonrushii TaxID=1280837 RepID=A0A316VC30_9BASI|nr:uncharacterized protein FA14DRAFT_154614 [Meira miltonrushii]PWN35189.1 hypothetical protein FA14DRAFT_154614 [Meira miltonrushii]
MSYLSQNGTWSTANQAPMTSQAGASIHYRASHQPDAQAWLNSSSSSHSSPFAAHSTEGTNSPMPSSSNINNGGHPMLSNPFDPNAFRMPAFSNAHDPSMAAPFAALLHQQQAMNGFGNVPGMNMSQQTWPHLQQFDASQSHMNATGSQNPFQGFPAGMQSGHGGSQPFTSMNQSNTSLANFPMLLSANNITASPSSIGRNSPNASNHVSGVPFVPGASPALVNSMISQNTSQSNSLVGTPSDGSMHSSDMGMQGSSMPSTSNDAQAVKTKRSSVGGSTAGTHRRIKFRRSRTGCLVCRKRKVKCDQDGLPCKQCKFGKRDCHYEENPLPKRRRKSTVSNVQSNEISDAEKKKGKAPSHSSELKSSDQQSIPQITGQVARKDDQSNVSQQAIFEKLRQAASQSSFMNLPDYGSNYGGDDDSKEPSEHWASTGSAFSAFHGGGDGEWNITTPSTGATSLHTVDGEMLGSNNSSRRVTLSDDRFEQFDFGSGTANLNGNQTNAGGIDIFAGFAAGQSTNLDGDHAAGIQNAIKDRKTSLSPLHMDAMHNRLSFDHTGMSNRINFQNQ